MPHQEFKENWQVFLNLIDQPPHIENEQINALLKHYIEQNVALLNDIVAMSIDNLNKLKKAKNVNDVICSQTKFSNEMSKKIALSTQHFLNVTIEQIADYNEWLKAHCDLATD